MRDSVPKKIEVHAGRIGMRRAAQALQCAPVGNHPAA